MGEVNIEFPSLDGVRLDGTLSIAENAQALSVLVHGITTDRNEDGFYTDLANLLSKQGISSLRFDLRGHGKSGSKYEEVTLCGIMNDIEAAVNEIHRSVKSDKKIISLIAASFSGGVAAHWCSEHLAEVSTLILLNPLLDYGLRMLYSKPFWNGTRLTDDGIKELNEKGWLPHGEFRMGRALIDELPFIRPYEKMAGITFPILTIHGDRDSSVPIEIARRYGLPNKNCQFVTIEGAEHGFTYPDDEDSTNPETGRFQKIVFDKILNWISDTYVK